MKYRALRDYETPATKEMRQIELPKEAFNRVILGQYISQINRNQIINSVQENIGDIPVLDYSNVC